ncbi:DUF5994 family protein [Streptomyces sp. NPDC059894]|uniref:DUF5994 family protein n=1 Tax=unclassified Streptomyces TaxID=2593676 RepID=UPI00364BB7C4
MDPRKARDEGAPTPGAHTYRMPLPRLSLTSDASHGPLDGAWWPRCDALELELPPLVGALDPGDGAEVHVTVDAGAWPDTPDTVMAPGHVIDVEPAGTGGGTHVITLDFSTVGRWTLLVVPPEEPAGAAARLLAAATDPALGLTADALLATEEQRPAPGPASPSSP